MDPSVLVTLLNDLERAGLALRRREPHDRRRHIVESTAAGDAVLARVDHAAVGYQRELLAGLSATEAAQLTTLLARLLPAEKQLLRSGIRGVLRRPRATGARRADTPCRNTPPDSGVLC